MIEIIPGVLEKEWSEIERKIELVSPFAKTLHIDIIDGKFAPNLTFLDPKPFTKYKDRFLLELHMMVEEPINYLKPYAKAGFKRFLGHVEKMSDQIEFVAQGQLLGEVGLALDGNTPVDAIQVSLDDLDVLLVMTINAGFSGQSFDPTNLEKAKYFRSKTQIPIEVDGGMNDRTITQIKQCGVTRFVSTSYIFQAQDPSQAFSILTSRLTSV